MKDEIANEIEVIKDANLHYVDIICAFEYAGFGNVCVGEGRNREDAIKNAAEKLRWLAEKCESLLG